MFRESLKSLCLLMREMGILKFPAELEIFMGGVFVWGFFWGGGWVEGQHKLAV